MSDCDDQRFLGKKTKLYLKMIIIIIILITVQFTDGLPCVLDYLQYTIGSKGVITNKYTFPQI